MLSTLLIPTLLSSLTAGAAELPPALAADYELLLDAARHQADSLAVSPDGRWAVASVHTEETHYLQYYRQEWRRVLVLVGLSDGSREVVTAPAEDAQAPVWLPDGQGVAFFARRDGRHGVEVLELSGRVRRRLAEMPDDGSGPLDWNPWLRPTADGRFLLYAVQAPGAWWEGHVDRLARGPADLPEEPIVIGPEARAPLLQAQGLGAEFFGQGPPMTVLAVPVAGGPARELASGEDLPAASYAWGAAGLLDGAWDGEGGRLLVADGPEVRVVPLGAAAPKAGAAASAELPGPVLLRRVLPDGTVLLLVSRRAEPTAELLVPTGRDVWEIVSVSVDASGGVRTASRARGPALPDGYPQALAANGRRLVVWRAVGPGAALVALDLASGETVDLVGADGVAKRRVAWLPAVDPAAEELLAVRSTATEPEVLVRVGLDGSARPVPGRWPGVPAELPVGAVETVRWQAPDGEEIEGVLVTPDDGARGRPYPTLLYLHGG
ncbi:MAG TPA: hypothetical protein VLF66_04140, partial [Thermoanaerobaculia bacterium]|nr:hypothetical protein [Thermoanaerobaculia bacterium]